MGDIKCDYCETFDGKYICNAMSKLRNFDEFAWAEDYPECDSNFYLGCPCYLYEIKPEVKEKRIKNNSLEFSFGDDDADEL